MRLPLAFLLCFALAAPAFAKGPKVHSAAAGRPHIVYWTTAQDPTRRLSLSIRPLIVDGRRKEWVTGETHDVTDHSFVALQVQHLNDSMPGDKASHFIWQTGAWLLVERNTGHVSQVKFAGYDPALSGISWFRDYAAYCALTAQGKSLYAEVTELGSRKPVARKKVSAWPLPPAPEPAAAAPAQESEPQTPPQKPTLAIPAVVKRRPSIMEQVNSGAPQPVVCSAIEWMRDPLRAVITPRADMPPVELDLSLAPSAAPPEAAPPEAASPAE